MDEIFKKIFTETGVFRPNKLQALSDFEKNKILDGYDNLSLVEAIYWRMNNLKDYPKKCLTCGNPIKKFTSFNQGYTKDYCSLKCSNNNEIVKNKRKQTSIKKFGTEFPWQNIDIKNKLRNTYLTNLWESNRFKQFKNYELLTTKDEFKNVRNSKLKWKCLRCELEFETFANNGVIEPECPSCFHHKTSSNHHREILTEIRKIYNGKILVNDRKEIYPYELDLYFPDEKIAIEFNGLYWHSFNRLETKEERDKHLNKTNICANKGIQLIHIFENEWINKKEIVLLTIFSKLKINKRIYARNCIIKEISNLEANDFLEKYHIQGKCISKIRYGLYLNNELVSLMTFGKPRFNKKYEWELIRYCSKYNVVGGASKLLNYFEKNNKPKNIVAYADKRWSNGNLYFKLGFNKLSDSSPNYFYFKNNNKLESRIKFQKHKLRDKLQVFDESLSEAENMFNNGYRRIWDCGNFVFVKKYFK
jgi:very-short-patch-repair endonuclease